MVDEKQAPETPNLGLKREISQIQFPYSDLERSVMLARFVHDLGGQSRVEIAQLAVVMDQSASGGTFRGRLYAAKMFGIIDTEGGEAWLTPLGLKILDIDTRVAAKAEAFLNIPLYKAMFEKYNGYALPPPAAIERQMETFGVPQKQKERARQAFSASVNYAGFIATNGRFSKPAIPARVLPGAEEEPETTLSEASIPQRPTSHGGGSGAGGGGGQDTQGLHPFIQGLLKSLPAAESDWSVQDRVKWLQTAASIFGLIYKGDGTITVTTQ
jgi:hypothetical protein